MRRRKKIVIATAVVLGITVYIYVMLACLLYEQESEEVTASQSQEAKAPKSEQVATPQKQVVTPPQKQGLPETKVVLNRPLRAEKVPGISKFPNIRRLVASGWKASWSPDGTHLAFGKPRGKGLQILDLESGKTTDLNPSGKDPAWSPDGRFIAYVEEPRFNAYLAEEVWLIRPTGELPRKLVDGGFPSWSADGKTVFVHSRRQNKILALEVDESNLEPRVFFGRPQSWYPAVSPDGKRIAFGSRGALVVVDRETVETVLRWPTPGCRGLLPSWSPDGNRIAFGGFENETLGLWVLDMRTKKAIQVVKGRYTMPAWSKDGAKLAFDLRSGNTSEVWMVETEALATLEPSRYITAEPAEPNGPTSLEKLDLSDTQTTDADLARRLEGLTSLQELDLRDTRVSDAGLVYLKDLTSLRSLNLSRSPVTGRSHPLLGQPLTDLKFTSLKGEQIDISKYKGKVVLVDFWATWCGPCVQELPYVKKVYSDYHDKGFEIIGISLDRSRTALEKFIESNNIPWPQYFDGKGWKNEISTHFDIRSIPATFLLDRDGIIQHVNLRGSALKRAVVDVLQGPSLLNNQITDTGLAHLKGLASLEVLRLENTQVTDEGLAHLKGLSSLKILYIGGTQVIDVGLFHLKNLSKLERFCVHNTQVTDAGLSYLQDLRRLKYLCVHDTQVGDAGLEYLKGLTALETLYLHNTRVTDEGLAFLKGLSSLRRLTLTGTRVTRKGIGVLKQALPSCKISGP